MPGHEEAGMRRYPLLDRARERVRISDAMATAPIEFISVTFSIDPSVLAVREPTVAEVWAD